jgi:hypothetical protein
MKPRLLLAVVLTVPVACGGGGHGVSGEDYVTQIQRVSVNAHIQERGLAKELQRRLKHAGNQSRRLEALKVYADQSARLYEDVVGALKGLQPPDEVATAQQRYEAAWQDQLDLIVGLRDAGFGVQDFLDRLGGRSFRNTSEATKTRCEQLQEVVSADEAGVDLACDGSP